MHDIRAIRSDPAGFDAALARRGLASVSPEILAQDRETTRCPDRAAGEAGATQRDCARSRAGQASRRRYIGAGSRGGGAARRDGGSGEARGRAGRGDQADARGLAQRPRSGCAGRSRRDRQHRAEAAWRAARSRVSAEAAFRAGRGARHDGLRDGRETRRHAICRAARRRWRGWSGRSASS